MPSDIRVKAHGIALEGSRARLPSRALLHNARGRWFGTTRVPIRPDGAFPKAASGIRSEKIRVTPSDISAEPALLDGSAGFRVRHSNGRHMGPAIASTRRRGAYCVLLKADTRALICPHCDGPVSTSIVGAASPQIGRREHPAGCGGRYGTVAMRKGIRVTPPSGDASVQPTLTTTVRVYRILVVVVAPYWGKAIVRVHGGSDGSQNAVLTGQSRTWNGQRFCPQSSSASQSGSGTPQTQPGSACTRPSPTRRPRTLRR
jgi:hypothetical protein